MAFKIDWQKEEKVLEGKFCTTIFAIPKTICRVRLRVRTSPFHGEDTGSNPVRGTKPPILGGFFMSVKQPPIRVTDKCFSFHLLSLSILFSIFVTPLLPG